MVRWPVLVFPTLAASLVFLGTSRAIDAQEAETAEAAESPEAPPAPATVSRPGLCLGYAAGLAYVVPSPRPNRRAPLPAAMGGYICPRTYYAGILAPWGSFPPALYAASIPLPQLAALPSDYSRFPYGQGVTVYRPPIDPAAKEPPAPGTSRPIGQVTVPETPEPSTGPEAIPAPQPVDVPGSTGSSPRPRGGLINPTPQVKPSRPAVRPTPSRTFESGPREF
jgi:hypothetical protein